MLLCEVEIIMYEELTSFLHGKQPINDILFEEAVRLDGQGTLAVLLWINRMNHFDFYILPGLIREGYISCLLRHLEELDNGVKPSHGNVVASPDVENIKR